MNILNLFEGMGVGHMALNSAGIKIHQYYSSEIDKYAAGVSLFNNPSQIQLGDVTQHSEWNLPPFDLLMGGSPCQGFSFVGKQKGMVTDCKIEITTLEQYRQLKSEGFKFNGQSYLFWEYVDILKTLKPKYFLIENVVMAKKWQDIITEVLDVEPILINSSLVSAQNRRRLYWCNWHVEQPEDKNILLKDIIDHSINEEINRPTSKQNWDTIAVIKNRGELQERNDKSMCIDANYHKGADNHGQRTQIVIHGCELRKTVPASECHHIADAVNINKNPNKSRCVSTVSKDTLLTSHKSGRHLPEQLNYRKLTPIECERLQTVPDDSTRWGIIDNKFVEISNSQRYKMLGNGWNRDTIVHILNSMPG